MNIAPVDVNTVMAGAKSITITWKGDRMAINQAGDVTTLEMIEILGGAVARAAEKLRDMNADKKPKPRIVGAAVVPGMRR